MKPTQFIITLLLFTSTFCVGQSIEFELDTIQVLQNSDAGNIASADTDNDGDLDLLIMGSSPIATTIYENDGNGNFTATSQPEIVNVYAGAAKFADVDNDGDQDLLITGNTSSPKATANLYLNNGSGSFSLQKGSSFEPCSSGDIDFGDIDGDNDLDLIMSGKNGSDEIFVKLYTNNGSGTFSLVNGTPFIPVWISATEFIDIDNDNDLDLLICGEDNSKTAVTTLYLNNGSDSFSTVTGTPFTGSSFGDIAFGDTDNDGDQDILITGTNNDGKSVADFYINNGSSFSLAPNSPFPSVSLHSSSFADFNNDGKLDLLHIGSSSKGLIGHIYENTGSNRFILADSSIAGSYNGTHLISDLNGDAKLDIVTTGTSFTTPVRAPKIYFNQSLTTSIDEKDKIEPFINVFPNPTKGRLNIETKQSSSSVVEIYDLIGNRIFQGTYYESSISIQLDVPSGVYLLHVADNYHDYNRKIIIE